MIAPVIVSSRSRSRDRCRSRALIWPPPGTAPLNPPPPKPPFPVVAFPFWAVLTPVTTSWPSARPLLISAVVLVTRPTCDRLGGRGAVGAQDEHRVVAGRPAERGGGDGQDVRRAVDRDGDVGGHPGAHGRGHVLERDGDRVRDDAAGRVADRGRGDRGDRAGDVRVDRADGDWSPSGRPSSP